MNIKNPVFVSKNSSTEPSGGHFPVKTKILASVILEHKGLVFAMDSSNKVIVSSNGGTMEAGPISVVEIPQNVRKRISSLYQVFIPHYVDNKSCQGNLQGFQKIFATFTSDQCKSIRSQIENEIKIAEGVRSLNTMVVLDDISQSSAENTRGSSGKKSTKKRSLKAIHGPKTNSPAKRSRYKSADTISSLSSEDLESSAQGSNKKTQKKKSVLEPVLGSKPCIPHLLWNTCKFKRRCLLIHDLPGFPKLCQRYLSNPNNSIVHNFAL